jgi:NDP-sugar pyrophosphorylase family protein
MTLNAMIFAAGLGSRLHPLTTERPKPAVPVALVPIAARTVRMLAAHGVSRIVMNTHHLGASLPELLAPHLPNGVDVRYVHERELLGTAGGLHNARAHFESDDVLVVNGDILFAPDLSALLNKHRESDAVATLVLREVPDPYAKGAIELGTNGRVVRMLAKQSDSAPGLAPFLFTGVHVLRRSALDELPSTGCIVRQGYLPWLAAQRTISGVVDAAPWRDLGTVTEYIAGNGEVLLEQGVDVLVDPSAHMGRSVRLRNVVVGAGARVADGVELENVVVWDGAVVAESLSNAVVTARHLVRANV